MNLVRRLWIGIFALTVSATVNADTDIEIEVIRAWNGLYKPNLATEIAVEISSRKSQSIQLKLGDVSRNITTKVGVPSLIRLPVIPKSDGHELLQIFRQAPTESILEQRLVFSDSRKANVAIVSDGLSFADREIFLHHFSQFPNLNPLTVSSESLPQFASAYAVVNAVVIHHEGLTKLTRRQADALSQYIAQCGKTVAVKIRRELNGNLQQLAGCGGQFLQITDLASELETQIAHLIHEQKSPLPSLEDLALVESVANNNGPSVLLAVFCAAYLILIFLASLSNISRNFYWAIPILTALVVIMIWHNKQPETTLISWAEMTNQQTTARYSAFMNIRSLGTWHETIKMPVEAALQNDNFLPFRLVENNGFLAAEIELDLSLINNINWFWRSTYRIDAPVSLITEQNRPAVINNNEQSTRPGFFYWKNHLYSLPGLKKGQTWQPQTPEDNLAENQAAAKILIQQSRPYNAALLIPFTYELFDIPISNHSWLFIHDNEKNSSS